MKETSLIYFNYFEVIDNIYFSFYFKRKNNKRFNIFIFLKNLIY